MDSRKSLIASMSKLLSKNSIENITVQMILDDAQVSRGTFYSYFADKYDLINAYFRDETKAHMMNVNDDPWVVRLTKGATFMKQNRKYFLRAFQSTGQNSFYDFWYHDSLTNVRKGIMKRSARTKLSSKEEQVAMFFTVGYMQLMINWVKSGMLTSPEKIATTICEFIPNIIKPYMW